MPKSGGIDWVLLLIVAGILVFIGISIWALLRFRKSRKETPSATFHGTVMWPRGRAGGMAAPKPGTPPQAPEQHEGTVMWPKGQAARAASRPPAPFTPSAPSAPPASQPPAPEEAEGTVMWPKGRAARAASGPPAAPVPPAPLAEPERQGSFFGALIRKCLPAKKPAPQTFSETVMYPRERGGRTAPESRAPSFQPPATPPRVDPGGPGTFSAPAPKEDPGWAMRLPPAPPRAAEASEAAPQAPGMTIQEEVEFLRRQLREMQARQDGSTSQPAPPQTPPEDPRRFP